MQVRNPKPHHFLGIDCALRNTGVVVYDRKSHDIVHAICIQTESRAEELGIYVAEDNARCIRQICAELELILLKYKIAAAFAELPHGGGKNAKAIASMCLATGGLVSHLFNRGIFLGSVTPLDVKRLVRPKGAVDKKEVEAKVREILGDEFMAPFNKGQGEHVADAAGALLAGLKKHAKRIEPSRV